jgi:hypothetical protein
MKREKTGGRKMGVKNIQGNELREKIKIFLDGNFDLIQEDFEKLDSAQRVTFYERILKYAVPVLKSIENIPDEKENEDYNFNKFSSEDLKTLGGLYEKYGKFSFFE